MIDPSIPRIIMCEIIIQQRPIIPLIRNYDYLSEIAAMTNVQYIYVLKYLKFASRDCAVIVNTDLYSNVDI